MVKHFWNYCTTIGSAPSAWRMKAQWELCSNLESRGLTNQLFSTRLRTDSILRKNRVQPRQHSGPGFCQDYLVMTVMENIKTRRKPRAIWPMPKIIYHHESMDWGKIPISVKTSEADKLATSPRIREQKQWTKRLVANEKNPAIAMRHKQRIQQRVFPRCYLSFEGTWLNLVM